MMAPSPLFIPQPVLWTLLGYQFEAASMLAGLTACISVRVWICLRDAPQTARARAIDVAVTSIALLFTAGWVVLQRPSPFFALLSGTGFGALGTGIIALSLRWVRQIAPLAQEERESSLNDTGDSIRASAKARPRARHTQQRRKH